MLIKKRNPKTDRKMMKFRIFCELLAKTMLESIDFTDVLEGYRRSPRDRALQQSDFFFDVCKCRVEMKSPRDRALQRFMCLY